MPFTGWSGDASGVQNPVDVVVDMEKKVKANFQRNIYAPLNATGQKVLNRSFSQAEHINFIKFEANPDNVDIQNYRIYRVVGGERKLIVTISALNGLRVRPPRRLRDRNVHLPHRRGERRAPGRRGGGPGGLVGQSPPTPAASARIWARSRTAMSARSLSFSASRSIVRQKGQDVATSETPAARTCPARR